MHTYARIDNDIVAEIIEPMAYDIASPPGCEYTFDAGYEVPIGQRFSAGFVASLIDITDIAPQPAQGWTYNGISFSAPAPPPAPSAAVLAAVAMTAGLTIASAGTPALNGTYAVDAVSQADIVAIETSLNAGKGFPGGVTTFNYPDVTGVMHAFTEANFTDFAAAVRDYVYALKSVIAGASTTLPAASTTIA